MAQHTIDIPDLPEGWKAVAYRKPIVGEFCWEEEQVYKAVASITPCLIIEKIQPRRIVLEETEEVRQLRCGDWFVGEDGLICHWTLDFSPTDLFKIWREVKE